MQVFTNKIDIQNAVDKLKHHQESIGFVPTMGALHLGHMSLVEEALSNNDRVIISIFVNPTQFDNPDDLKKYPRTLERDIALLKTISKDILVYTPSIDDIYNGNTSSEKFNFSGLEFEMEGKFRNGHFNGVGTVVKRLFEIVKPDNAYFGEKDFQQLVIIKKLVEKYNLPVNVVGCKIHRESNGLAMSSRNERLKPEYKADAPFIYNTLKEAKEKFQNLSIQKISQWVEDQFTNHEHLKLEYFIIADTKTLKPAKRKLKNKSYRAFIAVYADDIRLIDNILLN